MPGTGIEAVEPNLHEEELGKELGCTLRHPVSTQYIYFTYVPSDGNQTCQVVYARRPVPRPRAERGISFVVAEGLHIVDIWSPSAKFFCFFALTIELYLYCTPHLQTCAPLKIRCFMMSWFAERISRNC